MINDAEEYISEQIKNTIYHGTISDIDSNTIENNMGDKYVNTSM